MCWRPGTPGRHAVDAELVDQPVPEHLGRQWARLGRPGGSFWHAWTRAEALAKVTGTPLLTWLRTAGLDADAPVGVQVWHVRLGDLLMCCARAES